MRPRAVVLLLAALCLAAGALAAARARGQTAPDAGHPVVVGDARIGAAELESAAARAAGDRPRRLAAARRAAADRAIERRWLAGEAAEHGLRPAAGAAELRAQVADLLAGPRPLPAPERLAAAFDRFHERWRARTRCLPDYRDPYEDRCGDGVGAATGSCRWMGEATLCSLRPGVRRRWLVVAPDPSRLPRGPAATASGARSNIVRMRSRAQALGVVRAVYAAARAARERAVVERLAAARQAAERTRVARDRAARQRDPALAGALLAAAREACARQSRESDPYLFAFGLQDVVGQAEGLIAVRSAFALRVVDLASDDIDRAKLRPLADAIDDGNAELARMAGADAAGDAAGVSAVVARFDARTAPERAISRRLGLGDCLARPAR